MPAAAVQQTIARQYLELAYGIPAPTCSVCGSVSGGECEHCPAAVTTRD